MRVAVLGSWKGDRGEKMLRNREEFAAACEEIGRELARQKHTVVVSSDSRNTADLHVVVGISQTIQTAPDCECRVEVVRAAGDDNPQPYYELARKFPKHINFPPVEQEGWAETHLIQIMHADAVLTIGGAAGTYQAGLAAIVAKKLLVPVGTFGGASKRLGVLIHPQAAPSRAELATLNSPWSSHVLGTLSSLLGANKRPRLLVIHGRSEDRYKLTEWLRSTLGINDLLVMQQEFGGGQSLPEKFERLAASADGAIALATPDDKVSQSGSDESLFRARQNVWLEIGWMWGRLGRNKVLLLAKGQLDNPSDIQGLEYYAYGLSPVEASESIRHFVAQLSGGK